MILIKICYRLRQGKFYGGQMLDKCETSQWYYGRREGGQGTHHYSVHCRVYSVQAQSVRIRGPSF